MTLPTPAASTRRASLSSCSRAAQSAGWAFAPPQHRFGRLPELRAAKKCCSRNSAAAAQLVRCAALHFFPKFFLALQAGLGPARHTLFFFFFFCVNFLCFAPTCRRTHFASSAARRDDCVLFPPFRPFWPFGTATRNQAKQSKAHLGLVKATFHVEICIAALSSPPHSTSPPLPSILPHSLAAVQRQAQPLRPAWTRSFRYSPTRWTPTPTLARPPSSNSKRSSRRMACSPRSSRSSPPLS